MNNKSAYLLVYILLLNCGKSSLTSSLTSYPADGISGGNIILESSFFDKDKFVAKGEDSASIEITSEETSGRRIFIFFKSTKIPGIVKFQTEKGRTLELNFYPPNLDADDDGFPDNAELSGLDGERFRNWFVRIAESQYVKPDSYWNDKERDCAGLIRYSYKEALKKHDSVWFKKSGIRLDKNLTDIVSFNYPNIPSLGEKIFKIQSGDASRKESFGTFASAETLIRWNTSFVSRDISEARKGDLLFFESSGEIRFPFHSMVVAEITGKEQIVIYHTGEGNILKRVPISYLEKSKLFRVSPENSHFLGVYRFLILE